MMSLYFPSLAPLVIPAAVLALAAVARVASDLATQSTTRQSARVAQIEGAVSRVAGGIAHQLLTVSASTPADALGALKSAAVAEGAAYLAGAMPSTVAAAGATTDSLVAMISGEVGKQIVAAAGATLASPVAPAVPAPAAG